MEDRRVSRKELIHLGAALGLGSVGASVIAGCGGGGGSAGSGGTTSVDGDTAGSGPEVGKGQAIAEEAEVTPEAAFTFTDVSNADHSSWLVPEEMAEVILLVVSGRGSLVTGNLIALEK